ncbi:MAG: recombinase family protein [Rhizobiaceae bacterium]|nr:recombinase family protein [Rhizobiaceae bacterium]
MTTPAQEGRKIGYVRVSDADQSEDLQIDALKTAGCTQLYIDHGLPGAEQHRPALQSMLDNLTAGDTLSSTDGRSSGNCRVQVVCQVVVKDERALVQVLGDLVEVVRRPRLTEAGKYLRQKLLLRNRWFSPPSALGGRVGKNHGLDVSRQRQCPSLGFELLAFRGRQAKGERGGTAHGRGPPQLIGMGAQHVVPPFQLCQKLVGFDGL